MFKFTNTQLLGDTLKQAGLISDAQIQVALADLEYNNGLRFGEIVALRGWIQQQTADFFADEWQLLIERSVKYRLGYYLEKSGLLTPEQTIAILQEQSRIWLKFGAVAILQGVIRQKTVDFFLGNLFPSSLGKPAIKSPIEPSLEADATATMDADIKKEGEISQDSAAIDFEDIPWID